MSVFDAIVIGSGLGGLTAAALWARHGQRVCVIERRHAPGGAAGSYVHGRLAIESSLHEIDGLDAADDKMPILDLLGLSAKLRFVDVGDLYEVRAAMLGGRFTLPHGFDAAEAAAIAQFPRDAQRLRDWFATLARIRQGFSEVTRLATGHAGWSDAARLPARLWPLLRNLRSSVSEALEARLGDNEAAKLALAANLSYFHDDPAELSFLHFAMVEASYLAGGGHYVHGGSGMLARALVDAIAESGGTLRTGRTATRVRLDAWNRIDGVEHADAEGRIDIDHAPVVFGNAAPGVLAGLLPDDRRALFLARYAGRRPSISLFNLALGLDRPAAQLGVTSYSTFLFPDWMVRIAQIKGAGALLAGPPGERMPPVALVDYGRIDSGLGGGGPPYFVSLTGIDRLANWEGIDDRRYRLRREAWIDALLRAVDRVYPGFAGAVTHREMATARSMAHELNAPDGALYGFAPLAATQWMRRPTSRSPIPGLYLASAYTVAGGYSGAIHGGAIAAREAMNDRRTVALP